ncbi:MAG: hypothetical protein AAFZ18_17310 [Myxococcota bacterium]
MKRKKPGEEPEAGRRRSRWQRGTDVEGVVPPGRRLESAARESKWSASGVKGVTPPGLGRARSQAPARPRAQPNGRAPAKRPGRVVDLIGGGDDPDDIGAFLQALGDFITRHAPSDEHAEGFAELIRQSQAPFEIVVAFTVLSALADADPSLRSEHGRALERGARTFFNLARRLDPAVEVPPDLGPESVDPLFFDLPYLALDVPYAFAVDAFCRQLELLREDDGRRDALLADEAETLRRRFIERRAFGDQALRELFPWTRPDWAPVLNIG